MPLVPLLSLFFLRFSRANTLSSCSSFASQGYDCVPYYLCKDGNIVTDGEGVIDPRGLAMRRKAEKDEARTVNWTPEEAEEASCPVIFDVCCKDLDFTDQTSTPFPTSPSVHVVTCEALRPDTTVSVSYLTYETVYPKSHMIYCHVGCFCIKAGKSNGTLTTICVFILFLVCSFELGCLHIVVFDIIFIFIIIGII